MEFVFKSDKELYEIMQKWQEKDGPINIRVPGQGTYYNCAIEEIADGAKITFNIIYDKFESENEE